MQFNLRTLFALVSGFALVAFWCTSAPYTFVQTHRRNDITVIGEGWLCGIDPKTEKRYFFKSCTIVSDPFEGLLAQIDARTTLRFEPEFRFPCPTDSLLCTADGNITEVVSEIYSLCSYGQLRLALLNRPGKSPIFCDEDGSAAPGMCLADSKTGFFQTGWRIQREPLLERFKKMSFGEVAILFIACASLIQLVRPGASVKPV